MGHPGPEALKHLGLNSLGVKLKGPSTAECPHYVQAKIRRQTSRRPPDREVKKPLTEIHIDWTDLTEAYSGYVRVMYLHDNFSGRSFPYFMKTHGTEAENLRVLRDFIPLMKKKYNLDIKTIRSDNELNRKKTRNWLRLQGINLELSAPRIQAQNGYAERSGAVIQERARAMRLKANLPHDLWPEIVNCAVYLGERTPRHHNRWKSPFEKFYSYVYGTRKQPPLAHIKAYGCRAYAMTKDAQLKRNRRNKLAPRAEISYLVGYDSTNIYRIWIPHTGKVISTRDVIFDETKFFDGKRADLNAELIAEMDTLI